MSTEGIAIFTFATRYISSLNRYTTMEQNYREDERGGDDSTADDDADLAGDMEKDYSMTGVSACLARAPVG